MLLVFILFWSGMVVGWLLNSYQRFSRNRKRQLPGKPSVEASPVREHVESAGALANQPVVDKEKVKDEQ